MATSYRKPPEDEANTREKTKPKDSMRENPDGLIWALDQAMIEQV